MSWKRIAAFLIALVWTGLAAWAGWSLYDSVPKEEHRLAVTLVCILAVAWVIVLLHLKSVPRAISAILWLYVLFFGIILVIATLVPEAGLPEWTAAPYFACIVVLWLLVLRKWNSFIAVGNALYGMVWFGAVYWAVAATAELWLMPVSLLSFWPLSLLVCIDTFGAAAWLSVTLRVLIAVIWVMLLCFRIPWRYPWALLFLLTLALGPVGFVVIAIGLTKLIIESVGKRNVLARSRLKAGPVGVAPRGLVECGHDRT